MGRYTIILNGERDQGQGSCTVTEEEEEEEQDDEEDEEDKKEAFHCIHPHSYLLM